MAGNLNINYGFNYKKGDWVLNNKLYARYGLSKTEDDGVRKSDDRIELNSILGKKMDKKLKFFPFYEFQNPIYRWI